MAADFQQIETIFFDFDYTIVSVDSWSVLADIALKRKDDSEREPLQKEMEEIATLIDEGSASFFEALQRRINLLEPTRSDFADAGAALAEKLSPNIVETVAALVAGGKKVRVVAGSVREMIEPVCEKIGIAKDSIDCNELDFDDEVAVQADMGNPLSQDGGKQYVVSENSPSDKAAIIGDGPDDADVKSMGGASVFIAYTGARTLPDVVDKADRQIADFSELPGLFL